MYFGGTHFARWGGATPGIMGYIPSYSYAAPLSENGDINLSKYYNHANFARVISLYADVIINSDIAYPIILNNISDSHGQSSIHNSGIGYDSPSTLYAYSYGPLSQPGKKSLFFLFNRHVEYNATVKFNNAIFELPYWTVYIVDGVTNQIQFDSNILTDTSPTATEVADEARQKVSDILFSARSFPSAIDYQREPLSITVDTKSQRYIETQEPIDQLLTPTLYNTSYLIYTVNVSITQSMIDDGNTTLTIIYMNDYLYLWLDETFILSSALIDSKTTFSIPISKHLSLGLHSLMMVTTLMGIDNYTPDNSKHKGLAGDEILWGTKEVLTDGSHLWKQQLGLTGEINSWKYGAGTTWKPLTKPLVDPSWSWYRLTIDTPMVEDYMTLMSSISPSLSVLSSPSYQLNVSCVSKGFIYVNGHDVSLYWSSTRIPDNGQCRSCNRTGTLNDDDPYLLCQTGCGSLYQRGLYHIPASWLSPPGNKNTIVIFEEQKIADVSQIALQFWQSNED